MEIYGYARSFMAEHGNPNHTVMQNLVAICQDHIETYDLMSYQCYNLSEWNEDALWNIIVAVSMLKYHFVIM